MDWLLRVVPGITGVINWLLLFAVAFALPLSAAALARYFFERHRRSKLKAAIARLAKPRGGTHTCKHQRAAYMKCATPMCPDSPNGRYYTVTVSEGQLVRDYTFKRVHTPIGWRWQRES